MWPSRCAIVRLCEWHLQRGTFLIAAYNRGVVELCRWVDIQPGANGEAHSDTYLAGDREAERATA